MIVANARFHIQHIAERRIGYHHTVHDAVGNMPCRHDAQDRAVVILLIAVNRQPETFLWQIRESLLYTPDYFSTGEQECVTLLHDLNRITKVIKRIVRHDQKIDILYFVQRRFSRGICTQIGIEQYLIPVAPFYQNAHAAKISEFCCHFFYLLASFSGFSMV